MKKFILYTLVFALFLSAYTCIMLFTGVGSQVQRKAVQLGVTDLIPVDRKRLLAIQREQEDMAQRLDRRNQAVLTYQNQIAAIVSDVAEVAKSQKQVEDGLRLADKEQSVSGRQSVRERVNEHLADIERSMQEGRDQLRSLRSALRSSRQDVTALRQTVEELEGVINAQNESIQELRRRAGQLEIELAKTEEENRELRGEKEKLEEEARRLQKAYYVAKPTEELDELGIIEKRFLRSTELGDLDPNKFTEVSVLKENIRFNPRLNAKVFTRHNKRPDLYRIRRGVIEIKDPQAFWEISRFLVIELE